MGGNILDLVLTTDPERVLEIDFDPLMGNVKMGHYVISVISGMCLEDEIEPKQNTSSKQNKKSQWEYF